MDVQDRIRYEKMMQTYRVSACSSRGTDASVVIPNSPVLPIPPESELAEDDDLVDVDLQGNFSEIDSKSSSDSGVYLEDQRSSGQGQELSSNYLVADLSNLRKLLCSTSELLITKTTDSLSSSSGGSALPSTAREV